jgi:ATP-dependent Clp protease ATP-binding subunit ClpA
MTIILSGDILDQKRFDADATGVLDLAVGLAALTRSPKIRPAHILIAILQKDGGFLDGFLQQQFRGLRAASLKDALRENLQIEADLNQTRAGAFPEEGLPKESDLDEAAIRLIRHAHQHVEKWKPAQVNSLVLACSALEDPEPIILEVFRIAGSKAADLKASVLHLVASQENRTQAANVAPVEVFSASGLRFEAFEPTLARILQSLCAGSGGPILETDLLTALTNEPESLLASLLKTAGAKIDEPQQELGDNLAGRNAATGETNPKPERFGRVLRRIFLDAATIALERGERLISEKLLMLAHLKRAATGEGSIYERWGVDVTKLQELLSKQSTSSIFSGQVLQLARFGSVAKAALQSLRKKASMRKLLDSDLLLALLQQPESWVVEILFIFGCPVPEIRRTLETAGEIPASSESPTVKEDISEDQISQLLSRVIARAALMSGEEGCALVAESHLVRAHIAEVAGGSNNVYERLGIPVQQLFESLRRHTVDREPELVNKQAADGTIADVHGYLNERVINQPEAVDRAAKALIRMRSGLGEAGQILGKFLFLGPTGVGKTELARAMADVAFGPKPNVRDPYIIRIDCGNFQNRWDIAQLIGAAQGLVGYGEGQLTNGLKEKPQSVILFDEAEKADRAIWQNLLPLFDEGLVRDPAGAEYDATQCILVATSNVGYSEAAAKFDVWNREWAQVQKEVQEFVWNALREYFSPEFLGRFGKENVIFFNHFTRNDYRQIFTLQVDRLEEEMKQRRLQVSVDRGANGVLDMLVEMAWEVRFEGARPVRRLLTEHIRDQIIAARTTHPNRVKFHFICRQGSRKIVLEEC